MNLVVDVGNSLVKMAVFQEGILLKKKIGLRQDFFKNLEELGQKFPEIRFSMLSSVARTPSGWIERLKKQYQLIILNQQLPQVFNNLYSTPATLGNDRIALVSAACKMFPGKNVLIIDAGTCVTYDLKNDKQAYLGGSISPGLQMRFRALHTFTENLPLLEPEDDVKLVGDSTKSSMQSGVILGLTAEIEGVVSKYEGLYEDLTIIFTGGDAQFLCKRFKNSIFANSNFLLEGLNYILEFNKSQ